MTKYVLLHEVEAVKSTDRFFVCGGNPEINSGGGVIGSRNLWKDAVSLKEECIKQGYRSVKILTWEELND